MPTSILSNKSPFECLFRQTLDYAFLRTFGCLCFPFLRPYNAHKLDYRSTPCVFLGYSLSHLGYRCLDLSSDHIYISRHVRFHEQIFPFIEFVIPSPSSSPPVTVSNLPPSPFFHLNPSQPHLPCPLTCPSPHHHLHLYLLIIMQVQVLRCQLYLHQIHPLLQTLQPRHQYCLLHLGTLLSLCPVWTYVWISPHILFHS